MLGKAPQVEEAHGANHRAEGGAADSLDAIITDARPGIQNLSKSTLPEANQLVRELRDLSASLRGVTDRVEQQGIGGTLGPEKLPDYKPRKRQ